MAKTFTPKDAHVIMNELLKQATGQKAIAVIDSSSFTSAGEMVLATGMENVFNSLNIVLNRLIVSSRPYNAKMQIVSRNEVGAYSNRARKVSFYSQFALPDGSHNTDLYTNLAAGYTSGLHCPGTGPDASEHQGRERCQRLLPGQYRIRCDCRLCHRCPAGDELQALPHDRAADPRGIQEGGPL